VRRGRRGLGGCGCRGRNCRSRSRNRRAGIRTDRRLGCGSVSPGGTSGDRERTRREYREAEPGARSHRPCGRCGIVECHVRHRFLSRRGGYVRDIPARRPAVNSREEFAVRSEHDYGARRAAARRSASSSSSCCRPTGFLCASALDVLWPSWRPQKSPNPCPTPRSWRGRAGAISPSSPPGSWRRCSPTIRSGPTIRR